MPVKKEPAQSAAPAVCGVCGVKAKKVERMTVENLLKGGSQREIIDTQYYFCETPGCDVVYFSNETGQRFTKRVVRTRIGIKETQAPIPICYCFDFTEGMVLDELLTMGHTTIPDLIKSRIEAGRCACEVKNPSGRCCLGEVIKAVNRLTKEREVLARGERAVELPSADAGIDPLHACCGPKE
jgi:hypothetical protein